MVLDCMSECVAKEAVNCSKVESWRGEGICSHSVCVDWLEDGGGTGELHMGAVLSVR